MLTRQTTGQKRIWHLSIILFITFPVKAAGIPSACIWVGLCISRNDLLKARTTGEDNPRALNLGNVLIAILLELQSNPRIFTAKRTRWPLRNPIIFFSFFRLTVVILITGNLTTVQVIIITFIEDLPVLTTVITAYPQCRQQLTTRWSKTYYFPKF